MHGGAAVTAGAQDGESRRLLRLALAGVAAVDAVLLAVTAHGLSAEATLHGSRPLAQLLASAPVVVVIAGVALVALASFARGRAPIVTGLVAIAALGTLESTQASLFAGHQRVFFATGATLAGWLFGLAFERRMGRRGETLAEAGAVAGLAATYVDSGLSKLTTAGWLWADANTLRSAVLTNHPVDDTSPLASYARLVVENDAVAHGLAAATLVIQLGAVVYVLGPRLRMLWGALLLAFHVNVALVTQDIFYFQACILLLAFSFPWGRLARARAAPSPPAFAPEQTRAVALRLGGWVAAAAGAAWLVRGVIAVGR
ncbi:MAG TPA: hypothetical protein VIF15_14335 [Polyangiaceae bacterium]|jgi:hypothetical protein